MNEKMDDLKFSKEYNILENVHEEVNLSDRNNYKNNLEEWKHVEYTNNIEEIEKNH